MSISGSESAHILTYLTRSYFFKMKVLIFLAFNLSVLVRFSFCFIYEECSINYSPISLTGARDNA